MQKTSGLQPMTCQGFIQANYTRWLEVINRTPQAIEERASFKTENHFMWLKEKRKERQKVQARHEYMNIVIWNEGIEILVDGGS